MPEVAPVDIELPTIEPPTLGPPPRASIAARYSEQPQPPVPSAAPAELEAAVDALLETPPPPAVLDVGLLSACRGLEDLPPETQAELALRARVEVLAPDQEVSGFGLALVTRGNVVVMPTIAEGACGYAARGEPVFAQGTLPEGVPLRAVALAEGAEVAVWRPEDFEHVLATCPWVADELRAVGDRFQALAGAAMGPLGDRLDDHMRSMLTDRCELRVLLAGDVLIEEGKPPSGLFVVGAGHLEVVSGGAVQKELGPGDLPFASCLLTHESASGTVRAAAGGALILGTDRMTAHELIVSVPPLLELLSMV
jgi:CRP-like cAMP-binding protein